MFDAVRFNKASMQIISQIRGLILEGRLAPGDKLPSESALMEQFHVSKQTLKEALRALEYLGLLEMRKGVTGGAFVVEMDREVIREVLASFLFFKHLTIRDLSEVRKIVEPYTARIAAEKATEEDLKGLAALIAADRQQSDEYDSEDRKSDMEFHRTIAAITGNPILELIVDFVETVMVDMKKVIKPGASFSVSVLKAHERIYKALRKKDAEKAAREMHKHLVEVEDSLAELEEKTGQRKGSK
jgi:GntR family transcriptional regulator, transcriptional repressor for pyruvate dehydrogenase complex